MDFSTSLQKVVDDLQATWADRHITLVEFKTCLLDVGEFASQLTTELANPGPEKKALVLQAVGMAFDALWPRLPLPFGLSLVRPIVTSTVRKVVLAIAEADVEFIYHRLVKPADAQPKTENAQ